MNPHVLHRFFVLVCSSLLACNLASAQTYPEKTVVMVAPFPAGGSVDLVARAIAQHMSDAWKQPVIVSNRPGASGNIGAEAVARAAPDGYTLLMGTTALAGSPAIYPKLSYDLQRDLAPISLVVTMMNVLVVHPSLPARSVKELLALAKASPGTLNSASAGVGSSNHLALVLFNMMSGANISHIPYKGAAPAVADVMGGHVAMTFVPIAAALPPVRSGRLRALGVTATRRSAELPHVPTISEAGVSGYEAAGWNALLAPRATPREIVVKINVAAVDSLKSPRVKEILATSGADAVGGSPDELGRFLQSEITKWSNVVRAAGIKPE
ncbi:MAG TPA: tripartite tricarboxylate transporter substrate binding protein [Burkholderiales bacterium]|nr:tripartite tricarboxylate transporter substrate binding protein [Burkholderiales bacterium]